MLLTFMGTVVPSHRTFHSQVINDVSTGNQFAFQKNVIAKKDSFTRVATSPVSSTLKFGVSDDQREFAIELLKVQRQAQQFNFREIARDVGISTASVEKLNHQLDWYSEESVRNGTAVPTEADRAAAQAFLAQGISISSIYHRTPLSKEELKELQKEIWQPQ